ncbi:MAG: hypothetical protein M3Y42_20875 [Actinomycetota bacterium]|nr:hypothetical protein [Actinomycetota bacterium]MDQ2959402.1 hypothetical protein [Actinomycetota bacterium]
MNRPDPTAVAPDLARVEAPAVYLAHWWVPDAATGRADLAQVLASWHEADRPAGVSALALYLSADEDTVLIYAQCRTRDTYRPFRDGLRCAQARREPVEYRLCRSMVLDEHAGPPGALVAASFDVDGPERQTTIVDSILARIRSAPAADQHGLISVNFHSSVDGTRVINLAEWTTDQAHVDFLAGGSRHGNLRTTNETPGVRPIGYTRYHLYGSIVDRPLS